MALHVSAAPSRSSTPRSMVPSTLLSVDSVNLESQQMSLSHTRLELPYAFFGLGRINNYIEDFNLGVIKNGTWSNRWVLIIPNSQLFVSPTSVDPAKWKIEIFINPTKLLPLIIVSTIVVLMMLGMVIAYYHRKEKIEDNPADGGYGVF